MDLCVLPQTGVAEQWLLAAVVAVVLIGAGIALAVSGRARRSVLTGLGALAIIGALVAGGIGGAAPAQADAGSTGCVTAPAPVGDDASAATLVAPGIPTAAPQCAAEPAVQIPSTQGVAYSQSRTGSTLTVTAAPAAGYAFVSGATTSWTFDMTATTAAPWPVELPESTQATPVAPTDDGGSYLVPSDPELVPALQAAAAAGTLAYQLDASQFRIELQLVVIDRETGEELAYPRLSQPTPSTLGYDFELGAYVLGYDGNIGELDEFQRQYEALVLQYPDADIVPVESETILPFEFVGMQILASYEPGPGCGTVSAVVPIELVVSGEIVPVGDDPAPRFAPDSLVQGLDDVLETQPDAAPASEAPASETPAPEAPASQAPEAPSETDAASDSAEEVVEPTAPVTEP